MAPSVMLDGDVDTRDDVASITTRRTRFDQSSRLGTIALVLTLGGLLTGCENAPDLGSPSPMPSQRADVIASRLALECTTVGAIAPGNTVNGSLATTDCRLPDLSFVDYYELTLTSAQTVTVLLTSGAFDAYLILYDEATGDVLHFDDDSGGGLNARIQAQLPAGTYIIAANSYSAGEVGAYQLTVN